MRVAIVGLGKISDYHIKALSSNSKFEIVGGYDLNISAKAKLPDGSKFYVSFNDLLQDDSVECVILLTPGGFKKVELSRQILESGKNLISEKPVAPNVDNLRKLEKIAHENKLFIYGTFHSRFSPTAREITRLLDSGEYTRDNIEKIEIWADSPHIINWKIKGKSGEDTSLHGEGSNILAETLMYVSSIQIKTAEFVEFSRELPEVHTQINGTIPHGIFSGTTSWIRGIKEKGVRLIFSDGRQLTAIHTEQKIYNEKGEVIFDDTRNDSKTNRLQKDYNRMYLQIDEDFKHRNVDNSTLIENVVRLIDNIEQIMRKVPSKRRKELALNQYN